MSVNKLILGDNLEILKGMDAETVDLIYLEINMQKFTRKKKKHSVYQKNETKKFFICNKA